MASIAVPPTHLARNIHQSFTTVDEVQVPSKKKILHKDDSIKGMLYYMNSYGSSHK